MTSAKSAVEAASFAALRDAITGATVFQDVPDDEQPPVVIIGDIESEPLGAKGDKDRRVSLTVATITAGDERKPIIDLQEQIETTLDGARLTFEGWTLAFSFEADNAVLDPEGAGYVGTSSFSIIALRD